MASYESRRQAAELYRDDRICRDDAIRGGLSKAECDEIDDPVRSREASGVPSVASGRYGTCEVCGRAITEDEDRKMSRDIDFVEHSGHLIRRVAVGSGGGSPSDPGPEMETCEDRDYECCNQFPPGPPAYSHLTASEYDAWYDAHVKAFRTQTPGCARSAGT